MGEASCIARATKRAAGAFTSQDFVAGQDTSSTRRKVAGFDPRLELETFAISPDGARLAVAEIEWGSSLLLASGVAGVEPPRAARRGRN